VRGITRILDEDGARPKMLEAETALLGLPRKKGNFSLRFFPEDILPIAASTAEIAVSNKSIVLADSGDHVPAMVWEDAQTAHYVLRIPAGMRLLSIRSDLGELCAGISFTSGDGWLRFFISPHAAFSDRIIHVKSAEETELNLLDYTLRVDDAQTALPYLAQYYRMSHSAEALELALNELAGRTIIRRDCTVTEAKQVLDTDRYVYTTSDGEVYVIGYVHLPLVAGEQLYANQIIGKAVDVFAKSKSGSSGWWEAAFAGTSRGNSLSLQDINAALPAVTINNEEVRFWAYAAVDTTFHVRAEFAGTTGELNKYFNIVKQGELWAQKYWNDVLEFSSLLEEDDVNGLDFMFTHALHNALIVDIDTYKLGTALSDKIAYVAKREAPVGSIPIIRKWSSVG
jgi:hypothetical protein